MGPNVTKKLLYNKEHKHLSTEAVYRMEKKPLSTGHLTAD